MPRQDWREDDFTMRDRDYRDFEGRDRGYGRDDHSAFFDSGRGRSRERGLLRDESSGGRRNREFGSDDNRSGIPTDETERLIASNKVEGTPVYDVGGERLGTIHNFMVDKFRGKVVYAVLKHGSGFLGLDDRYYPLEWEQLRFDTRLGGYRIDMTEDDLKRAGSWDRNERWSPREQDRMRRERDRLPMREAW